MGTNTEVGNEIICSVIFKNKRRRWIYLHMHFNIISAILDERKLSLFQHTLTECCRCLLTWVYCRTQCLYGWQSVCASHAVSLSCQVMAKGLQVLCIRQWPSFLLWYFLFSFYCLGLQFYTCTPGWKVCNTMCAIRNNYKTFLKIQLKFVRKYIGLLMKNKLRFIESLQFFFCNSITSVIANTHSAFEKNSKCYNTKWWNGFNYKLWL